MNNNRVVSMNKYQPTKHENVVIDTNILIKQFYPTFYETASDIDEIFKKLQKEKCNILLSSIQISEFINRYIRFCFDLYKSSIGNQSLDFKTGYRSTEDYTNSMNDILDILNTEVIPICTCINDGFDRMNGDNLYRYSFSYDFNDALIVELARINEATIITNDHDFLNYSFGGKIVTNNWMLLSAH